MIKPLLAKAECLDITASIKKPEGFAMLEDSRTVIGARRRREHVPIVFGLYQVLHCSPPCRARPVTKNASPLGVGRRCVDCAPALQSRQSSFRASLADHPARASLGLVHTKIDPA